MKPGLRIPPPTITPLHQSFTPHPYLPVPEGSRTINTPMDDTRQDMEVKWAIMTIESKSNEIDTEEGQAITFFQAWSPPTI